MDIIEEGHLQVSATNYTGEHVITTDYDEGIKTYISAVKQMRNICIPCFSFIGLFGNTLSLLVFCARSMRRTPHSVFLAALAIVDNLFLVSLVLTWIDGELLAILVNDVTCRFMIFVTYVSSFLSVWFIVGFTFERFCAICCPLRNYMFSVSKQKKIVLILSLFSCALYHFSFWTVTVIDHGSRRKCVHLPTYISFLEKVTWVDTVVTMVIPFVIITVMNAKVLHEALKCSNFRKHKYVTIERLCKSTIVVLNKNGATRSAIRTNPRPRVTRYIVPVSTVFLLLNLPSHAVRLYNLIKVTSSGENGSNISIKLFFVQEIALMLYYATFACNFFLYILFSKNFTKSLKTILLCRSSIEEKRQCFLRKLSATQGSMITTATVNDFRVIESKM